MNSQLLAQATAWMKADPDAQTVQELSRLLEEGNEAEVADRFAGSLEFGTAGLRGVLGAGPNRMNRAVVRRTTAGLARYLKRHVPDVVTRGVVVGRDARRLSPELAEDTAYVFAAEGIPVWFFAEPVPTPMTAFATLHLQAAASVMVTASHNPPEYNGYKVYWGNGAQIIPPHDVGIAAEVEQVEPAKEVKLLAASAAREKGLWREISGDVEKAYLDAIDGLRLFRKPAPFPVVYSAMHGVGGKYAEFAFKRANFALHVVKAQHAPDGSFPTVRFPNPEEPGAMDLCVALAEDVQAHLVLANDPDADRLAVWVRGKNGLVPLTGNEVGVLLGYFVLTQTKPLPSSPLVINTIVSSAQLESMARGLGARHELTLTGFKWIANRALELQASKGEQFVFGYEEALGYTVGTVVRDKDGIGAALVFADLAAYCHSKGQSVLDYLEEIQRRFGLFVSKQANFTFKGTQGATVIAEIMDGFRRQPPTHIGSQPVTAVNDYRLAKRTEGSKVSTLSLPSSNVISYELGEGSRITLRPSGTEPKIKYYFEWKETLQPNEAMSEAKKRAQERLNMLEESFLKLARSRGQP